MAPSNDRSSHGESRFYIAGGTVPRDAPSYVVRQADEELLAGLRQGEFCYVLTSRQMGKSSLMVRAAARLKEEGCAVVVLDLTAVGQNLTAEQWYDGLLNLVGRQLGMQDALDDFWLTHERLGPLQRWMAAIREVALPALGVQVFGCSGVQVEQASSIVPEHLNTRTPEPPRRLVVFIDEIDAVRSLPFSTDEFFAAIRECYNRRTEDAAMNQITFCLLGVATPSDLIRDTRMTPFNIGRRIELTDFTDVEAAPLAWGLVAGGEGVSALADAAATPALPDAEARRLLARILYWTGGHPYLTQRLCRAVAEANAGTTGTQVRDTRSLDLLCDELFLSSAAQEKDDNLLFVRERLLKSEPDLAALLEFYGQIRAGRPVTVDNSSPLVDTLRLSGITRGDERRAPNDELRAGWSLALRRSSTTGLQVRNRIYGHVFDRAWVAQQMPDAELQRQRSAFRRGLVRATSIATVIVCMMSGLALTAVSQKQRAEAATTRLNASLRDSDERLVREKVLRSELQAALQQGVLATKQLRLALSRAHAEQQRADREAQRAKLASRTAQQERGHAEQQRRLAEVQRTEAVKQREESRRRLVRMTVANGTRLVEDGDLLGSLPWFAEALRLDVGRPEREEMHRMRLASVMAECPRLAQTWSHKSWVNSAAFSPDGRQVVTASDDRTAQVWDVATGRAVGSPLKHDRWVAEAAFSPDGRRVVTASEDRTARIWDASTGKPVTAPLKHTGSVRHAEFSPDGRLIVTAAVGDAFPQGEGEARIWNAATGQLVLPPLKQPQNVWYAAFSPDSSRVITACGDGTARVWDVTTGQPVTPALVHGGESRRTVYTPDGRPRIVGIEVRHAAFSPDGRRVVTGGDGEARVWDATTGQPVTPVLSHSVWRVGFSPDGRRVFTAGSEDLMGSVGAARVWDATTGAPITPPMEHLGGLPFAWFSADGRRLVTAGADNTARVWDAATGQPIGAPLKHSGGVTVASFSPDGHYILTASNDHTVRLWATVENDPANINIQHRDGVRDIRFSPDGHRVVTASADGTAQVWDVASGKALGALLTHARTVQSAAFSPDGGRVVTASSDWTARVWDATSGRPLTKPLEHGSVVTSVAFSPDGRRIVTTCFDGTARIWDAATGAAVTPFVRHPGAVHAAAFSPDGRYVATASGDQLSGTAGEARVWDTTTGQLLFPALKHPMYVFRVAVSPDGRRIVTGCGDGNVRFWDSSNGRLVMPPIRHGAGQVNAIEFSPDRRRIATCGEDNTARVWDAATGQPMTPPLRHQGLVWRIAFSPDGRRVATGSGDGVARVWDAATGDPLTPPLRHEGIVRQVAFSPGGRRLATASRDKTARIWDLPRDDRPLADLLQWTQVLSGQRIDATAAAVPLEPEALRRAWEKLRAKHPAEFGGARR